MTVSVCKTLLMLSLGASYQILINQFKLRWLFLLISLISLEACSVLTSILENHRLMKQQWLLSILVFVLLNTAITAFAPFL